MIDSKFLECLTIVEDNREHHRIVIFDRKLDRYSRDYWR